MKYMLLIYNNADAFAEMTEEVRQAIFTEVDDIMGERQERGEYLGGVGLAHPSTTKAVMVRPA